MKRLDSILLKVFFCALPVVIILGIFAYYNLQGAQHTALSGLVFASWMVLTIYLSIRLMISVSFREKVLAKLTFMKERDEREVLLTGKAIKTTFLTSLAILIFLFCLSCFQVSIYKVPAEKAMSGKTGFVTLGLQIKLLESATEGKPDISIQRNDIFTYTGLPITNTALIVFLIMWQIFSYNYSMRRLEK